MKHWLKDIQRVDVLPRPTGIDLRYSEWTEPLEKSLFDKFITTLKWEDFGFYPDTNLLKNKLADLHNVSPVNIFLAPGSSEAIKAVFDCYNIGESIITTAPCFPMYDVYSMQNKLELIKIDSEQDRYRLDTTDGANFIIFSRPSNPVGYFFTRKEVINILEQHTKSWVLVDEAYIDYVENKDDIINLISSYDNLIISRSLSKTHGAAGCRIGYLISHSKNIDMISKFRQMYEISGPAMKYALFLLENQEIINDYTKRTIKERNKLYKLFGQKNLDIIQSEGNWMHIQQTEKLLETLSNNKIYVKKNILFPNKDGLWIRFTIGPGVFKLFKEIL